MLLNLVSMLWSSEEVKHNIICEEHKAQPFSYTDTGFSNWMYVVQNSHLGRFLVKFQVKGTA